MACSSYDHRQLIHLAVIGQTGDGITEMANSIASKENQGIKPFDDKSTLDVSNVYAEYCGQSFNVIDAPGLRRTDRPDIKTISQVKDKLYSLPGKIVCFLFVVAAGPFSDGRQTAFKVYEHHFGPGFGERTIIIFMGYDAKKSRKPFNIFLQNDNRCLNEIIKKCGRRCIPWFRPRNEDDFGNHANDENFRKLSEFIKVVIEQGPLDIKIESETAAKYPYLSRDNSLENYSTRTGNSTQNALDQSENEDGQQDQNFVTRTEFNKLKQDVNELRENAKRQENECTRKHDKIRIQTASNI